MRIMCDVGLVQGDPARPSPPGGRAPAPPALRRPGRPGRRLALIGGTVLVPALVAAVLLWQHSAPFHRLRIVTPGVLVRSDYLRPADLKEAIDTHGIRTVVDLTIEGDGEAGRQESESLACREKGVEYVGMPIRGEGVLSSEQLERWLGLLDDPDRRPLLVHCKHGVQRTGMCVAVYQMEYLGYSNRQAIDAAPLFGHELNPAVRDYIQAYRPRGPVPEGAATLLGPAR